MANSSNIYHARRPPAGAPAGASPPLGLAPFDFRNRVRRRLIAGGSLAGGLTVLIFGVILISDLQNRRRIEEVAGRDGDAASGPATTHAGTAATGEPAAAPERQRLTLETLAPNLIRSLADTNTTASAGTDAAGAQIDPATLARARRLLDQARVAGAAADYATALDLLEAARVLAPELPGLGAYLGYIRLQREEYAAAIELLEAALAASGPDSELLNQLAVAYAAQGDQARAIELLRQLIARDSYHAEGLANLGRIELERGMYDAASEHLNSYVRLFPNDAPAHNRLGLAYLNLNQLDRARESFRQAQQLDPSNTRLYIHLALATALAQSPGEGIRLIERAQPALGRTVILTELASPLFDCVRALPAFIQFQRATTAEAGAAQPPSR